MKSIEVKMLKTTPGSPDGLTTVSFKEGKKYDMPSSLAEVFVDELEVAEIVVPSKDDEGEGEGE